MDGGTVGKAVADVTGICALRKRFCLPAFFLFSTFSSHIVVPNEHSSALPRREVSIFLSNR